MSYSHLKPVEIHWIGHVQCQVHTAPEMGHLGYGWCTEIKGVHANQIHVQPMALCIPIMESNDILDHSRNLHGYLKLKDANHSQLCCMCMCKPPLSDQFVLPVQTSYFINPYTVNPAVLAIYTMSLHCTLLIFHNVSTTRLQ